MAKVAEKRRTVYYCRDCGHESAKWMGFCPSPHCQSTRPLTEGTVAPAATQAQSRRSGWIGTTGGDTLELSELSADSLPRITLPSPELNRVLGGGVVPGSVALLTGEPGVGKSTLLLQLAHSLASAYHPRPNSPHREGGTFVKLKAGYVRHRRGIAHAGQVALRPHGH